MVHIDNQYEEALDIFYYQAQAGASATNASSLYPLYVKAGTVAARTKEDFTPPDGASYLEFARQSDGFPVSSVVPDILNDTSISITDQDEQKAEKALAFY